LKGKIGFSFYNCDSTYLYLVSVKTGKQILNLQELSSENFTLAKGESVSEEEGQS